MKIVLSYFSFLICLISFSTFAHAETNFGCVKVLKSRSGTVYAAGPAKTTFTATERNIEIEVRKRGGKARTTVNIYVNGVLQSSKRLIFENGKDTPTRRAHLNNVRGKTIRVDIINQSVGNKFEYSLKAKAETNWLGSGQGNLAGQGKKTFTLSTSCDNNARIRVVRKGGSAKAIIKVMRLNGQSLNGGGTVIDKNRSSITIPVSGVRNQRLRVEVKNVSVGNWFRFEMNANSN